MNRLFPYSVLLVITLCLPAFAQTDIARYGITQTDGLSVSVRLGGDGIRGGGQLLLVFEMSDGRTRRFDLNRTREEWPGGAEKAIDVTVVPPMQYSAIQRIGIEWHGSQGDITQEQDDFDLARLHVESTAVSTTTPIINGSAVLVYSRTTSTRFDNDQTQWFGGVRPTVSAAAICTADSDCDDRRYCNGVERCEPSNASADARGCIVGVSPCPPGENCNEAAKQCDVLCVDNDGDGHQSVRCGGDDCDDSDANRYPGNVEVWDAANHDEDCDVNTHGIYRGASATQICDGRIGVVLVDEREQFERARCTTGTVCVQQPNGTGVCMTEPAGYQAPSAAILPSGPQSAPPDQVSSNPLKRLPSIDLRKSGSGLSPSDANKVTDKKNSK